MHRVGLAIKSDSLQLLTNTGQLLSSTLAGPRLFINGALFFPRV